MTKKIILILFLLSFLIQSWALELKGPVLVLGNDESKANESNYKIHEMFKIKDVLIRDNEIYVLEQGNAYVHRFDMKGNSKGKIGGMGAGPSEFYEPKNMAFVGENLWVVDYRNGRIQEFRDFEYVRPIKMKNPPMPSNIAVSGNNVFVSGTSVYPWQGLPVFDHQGNFKKAIKLNSKYLPNTKVTLWYIAELKILADNRLMVGYTNLPLVFLIDKDLGKIRDINLSEYYSKYETRGSSGAIFPSGYAITSFCSGPNDTILISVCDNKKRKCSKILQFSADLSKKTDEFNLGFHVWEMDYYPGEKLMVFLSKDEVLLYNVQ